MKHVNPPIDSQVLLFHGVSERSGILHEEITLSQADTESVVGSARTHFTISINLHVPPKKKLLWIWARRVRVQFRNMLFLEITKLMKMRGGRQTSRVRMSMLFLVLRGWRSPGLLSRVSFSQKWSQEIDWRDRICLKVLLTQLYLRNVSFQNFRSYH